MKLTKIFTAGIVFSLFLMSSVFAQNNASANANVTAQLKKGLSIQNLSGDLDFGPIVLNGTASTPQIAPGSGVKFGVIGHPGKAVTVSFSNINLDNSSWATANTGTSDLLAFSANVDQSGGNDTYTDIADVTSGDAINLVNSSGLGYLYLWLGGSLDIRADQAPGDYVGTFTMSVAYN